MTNTCSRLAAFGFVLFTIATAQFARADEWNKKTVIRVNEPLQIQGKTFEPGKYVIKLLDSQTDRHIVLIYDAHETKLQMTILANCAYRTEPTADTRLTLTETDKGRALHSWFFPGDYLGLEFSAR